MTGLAVVCLGVVAGLIMAALMFMKHCERCREQVEKEIRDAKIRGDHTNVEPLQSKRNGAGDSWTDRW